MRSRHEKLKVAVLEALEEFSRQPRPFNCNHCPRNADAQRGPHCPAWGSILLTTVSPGGGEETKVVEECYFNRMEKWHEGIHGTVKINIDSINEVREEISEARNHTTNYLTQIMQEAANNFPALQNSAQAERGDVALPLEQRRLGNGKTSGTREE